MFLSFRLLLCILAFAPRSSFSVFDLIAYSPVQQCGPFNVSFSGGQPPTTLPLTLTVIPFNSTPLTFTIPESAWENSTSSGSYVTLLPLRAGVSFMASLDDAAGHSAALISNVIQVLPSTNSSCISTDTPILAPFQLVDNATSQCSPFSVSKNVSQGSSSLEHSLSARVFIPTSLSFTLPFTAFLSSQGVDTFTYIMNVAQGLRVALLFDDGQGSRQVSNLLLVGGGPSSPSGCLRPSSASPAKNVVQGMPRSAVIAISVSSSVGALIILIFGVVLIRRERRKLMRHLTETIPNQGTNASGPQFGPPVPPKPALTPAEMISSLRSLAPVDPVYPAELFTIASNESRVPQSTRSTILAPFYPPSLRSAKSQSSLGHSIGTRTRRGSNSRTLVDWDIARLLEVASQQPAPTERPRGYPHASPHTVTPAPTPSVPPSPSASLRSVSNPSPTWERSNREPDVPLSPLRRLSQEWLTSEQPSIPTAAVTVVSPGAGSRTRPLPTPSLGAGVPTSRKKPERF
ncbi:hypothetical protein BJV74DRAFT_881072 [Russula compacta]|nr:hypothetical protein BJV74DRAFT_881072 [Russula compacta]